jgi:tetratricopeptide (TPR) repeat protein
MAAIKETILDGPSANDYRRAAQYYLQEEKELETALEWINIAIGKRAEAFWYIYNKAEILAKLGKKKEAIAAAEKSMEMAKVYEEGDYGYIKRNEELIAKIKKG